MAGSCCCSALPTPSLASMRPMQATAGTSGSASSGRPSSALALARLSTTDAQPLAIPLLELRAPQRQPTPAPPWPIGRAPPQLRWLEISTLPSEDHSLEHLSIGGECIPPSEEREFSQVTTALPWSRDYAVCSQAQHQMQAMDYLHDHHRLDRCLIFTGANVQDVIASGLIDPSSTDTLLDSSMQKQLMVDLLLCKRGSMLPFNCCLWQLQALLDMIFVSWHGPGLQDYCSGLLKVQRDTGHSVASKGWIFTSR